MLFKYADDLHSAMLSGKGKDILGKRPVALTGEIMKFLSDWLNHHIGEIDKKVGRYLQQQAH
jgi:hemerythrin